MLKKTQSYDFKTKFQEEPTAGITTTQLILITFSKTQPRLISKGGPKQSRRAENDSDGTISSEEFHASKGQIISKCPLEILDFPKIPRKF